jgi:thioredoxin reductase
MSACALPAVVIGAGPYGLSVAAHLRARGVGVRVFGEPMESWRRNMPAGMFLKSVPDASSLSAPAPGYGLADYCRVAGLEPPRADRPVPLDLFVRYGEWFQQRLVPDVDRARVTWLQHGPGGFSLRLGTGEELTAGAVVVATGLLGYRHVPTELAGAADSVSHSWDHSDLARFAGRDVVVIGGGQSALESAVLLHEAGARVRVLARRQVAVVQPPRFVDGREPSSMISPWTPLGRGWRLHALARYPGAFRFLPTGLRRRTLRGTLGPAGSWWLRDRLTPGVQIHPRYQLRRAACEQGRVVLEVVDPQGACRSLTTDHVIAATGYQVDIDRLDFLSTGTRSSLGRVAGSPRLNGRFESSVPGLYFVGHNAVATFGSVQRFVCGAGIAATRVSGAVAGRATRTPALALRRAE